MLDSEQEQRPYEQRLRQAVDNCSRLKTIACDPATQAHSLSRLKVNCDHPVEGYSSAYCGGSFHVNKSSRIKDQRHDQAEDAEDQ